MREDEKRKAASKAVKAARRQFERDSKAARDARRKAFAQAQKAGSRSENLERRLVQLSETDDTDFDHLTVRFWPDRMLRWQATGR